MASRPRIANRRLLARLIFGPATVLTSVNLDRGLAIDPGSSSELTSSPADLPIWSSEVEGTAFRSQALAMRTAVRGRTAAANRSRPISLNVQS